MNINLIELHKKIEGYSSFKLEYENKIIANVYINNNDLQIDFLLKIEFDNEQIQRLKSEIRRIFKFNKKNEIKNISNKAKRR